MPKVSPEVLKMYFDGSGSNYPLYKEAVSLYEELSVHADGRFPDKLIKEKRPSEPPEIFEYRKATYQPITKLAISQALNCYGKIRRSPDWMITFPEKKSGIISDEETLERYCSYNLPGFVSITNWVFDILLKQNLIDANALVAVIPLQPISETEFCKPVPILFNSDQVMFYSEEKQYAILKSKVNVRYLDTSSNYQNGFRFFYIDENEIIIYEQNKSEYVPIQTIVNVTGQFPVFKVKSEHYKQHDNMSLNRSRLHAMAPFLNKAATGDSDLEGSKTLHLFPLMWKMVNNECPKCKGTAKQTSPGGLIECKSCKGTGRAPTSPYSTLEITPPAVGTSSIPTPPMGYIVRDTEILKLQQESIDRNCFRALEALNMQFLAQTPLAVSGESKQVDREELNNTVYNTAEDLVYAADKVIGFINEWRYSYVVKDGKTRREMLPNIPVPQNFDLLPEDYLMKEVTEARSGKVNPLLIATLEQQLAAKKFYNHPDLADNIKLYFELDPLPGTSIEEKMSMLSNGGITKEDYVISSYMAAFIRRALREDKTFGRKGYEDQVSVLKKYAKEKMDTVDEATQLINNKKEAVIKELNANAGAA